MAAPIVDIEDIRRSGEIGNYRDLSFALSGSRGNEDRDNIDLSISFVKQNSYKNKKGKVTNYWSVCVTFRTGEGKKTRLFPLGNEKKIKEHMLSYFKSN